MDGLLAFAFATMLAAFVGAAAGGVLSALAVGYLLGRDRDKGKPE